MKRQQRFSRAGARAAAEALFALPLSRPVAGPVAPSSQRGEPRPALAKKWCRDADVFVGPEFSRTRAWHCHPPRAAFTGATDHAAHGLALVDLFPEARETDPIRLRVALRKERRAGLSGALGYSIERHYALATALAAQRASIP